MAFVKFTKIQSAMKKCILFFLSLTFFTANAQFNSSRTVSPHHYLATLNAFASTKFNYDVPANSAFVKIPYFILASRITPGTAATLTDGANTPIPPAVPINRYWSGQRIYSSSADGRFQSIQSFDLQGNFRETKATYQFKRRNR